MSRTAEARIVEAVHAQEPDTPALLPRDPDIAHQAGPNRRSASSPS